MTAQRNVFQRLGICVVCAALMTGCTLTIKQPARSFSYEGPLVKVACANTPQEVAAIVEKDAIMVLPGNILEGLFQRNIAPKNAKPKPDPGYANMKEAIEACAEFLAKGQ